jgi:arylsulfatase A-like enzyme
VRALPRAAFLAPALLAACRCGPPPADLSGAEQPRVVFIVIDTLRADRLGAAGYARPTSPVLDALAAEGAWFERAVATSSWTRPSFATLMTGRYAREVGIYEERFDRLPDEALTVAERLDAAGWVTLGVTSNPNVNAVFGFDQGFDEYRESGVVFKFMTPEPGQSRFGRNQLDDAAAVTDAALDLVDRHAAALADAPLFLQVHYIDPHIPYAPPAAHLAAIGGGEDRDAKYDGEIHYADAEIGRLLDGLRARGALDGALVLVTSDHGEGLGDHHPLPHAATHGYTLYDSVIRVPLLVWGGGARAGTRVGEVVSLLDVAPTILGHAGLDASDLPGRPLQPLAAGGAGDPERVAIAETDWRYVSRTAARSATHLLVRNPDAARYQEHGAHEEADLPRRDLAMLEDALPEELYAEGDRVHPIRARRDPVAQAPLAAALDAWAAATPLRPPEDRAADDVITLGDGAVVPDPWAGTAEGVDEATRGQLEALGYLGGD